MAKPNSKGGRLSAEERLLEKQREDLMRRASELEKKLKHIPLVMERNEQQKIAATKKRAADAGPSISPYMGRRSRSKKSKSYRMPSRERFAAKIQTIALLLLFALIVFMLFKVLPTGTP